jgi:tetratricopeptide (TPR) repeat protein
MKRLNNILAILLVPFASAIFCRSINAQNLDSAKFLTRCEQYDKAQTVYDQLIRKEPSNSKYYFFYGENYLLDYLSDTISSSLAVATASARDLFEKGIKANPADPLNYIGLAKVAFYTDDYKTADQMRAKARSLLLPYKNIKKIKPPAREYAFALAKIAESFIKEDKVDTSLALPFIRQAINIDYKSKDVYLIAGDIYILVNDGSNSISNYNLAQYYDPKSPAANMKIGSIYVKGRNLMAAIPYFEAAIRLNASYAPAYRELGQLYSSAGRYEKSKEYYKKYLELTQGNIPAKIRYITSLFYAKEYDEVIKNVEEIIAVDNSRTYMNRIAGYSCYEKTPPDYDKALAYMDTLFSKVSPERIIKKDYYYMVRILLGKNQNYQELLNQNNSYKHQLDKEKKEYDAASSAQKTKLKPGIDSLSFKIGMLDNQISSSEKEIDMAFAAYAKLLSYDPESKSLLNEIAGNYYRFGRYENAAKTWSKLIELGSDDVNDYMRVGKAYYIGENYKAADSSFNAAVAKFPDYLDAYLYIARTNAKMDPGLKSGQACLKFEKVLEQAEADSIKNSSYIMEACDYLGYYHLMNDNYNLSEDYYRRMINLDTTGSENKIKGYNGLGAVEIRMAGKEKTLDGKLVILKNALDSYRQILAIDPKNRSAEGSLKYVQDYQTQVRKEINPNEIKGIVKNSAGQPVHFASVRVKDTAAETYTDNNGEFKFEIPKESESLIISAKGFRRKEVPVQRPLKRLTIVLEQE